MGDEALVIETRGGNIGAFAELIARYELPLLRYVVYLVHDADTAEDVVQDTFIKAYRKLAGFNTRRKFSSWIYRIAHNTAMDTVKKRHAIRIPDDPDLGRYARVEPSIAEQIDREIMARDVGQCLGELAAKYKAPLLLYFFQQKSYSDISDILRLPTATVGVRIKRAKALLRTICKRLEVGL